MSALHRANSKARQTIAAMTFLPGNRGPMTSARWSERARTARSTRS